MTDQDQVQILEDEFLLGRVSRRGFIRRAAALGISMSAIGAFLAACSAGATPAPATHGSSPQPAVSQPAVSQPALGQPPAGQGGGPAAIANTKDFASAASATFTAPTNGDPGVIVKLADGSFVAYDAICTHAGCTVAYDPRTGDLLCPCHGSTYDPAQGAKVLARPAPKPLTELPIKIDQSTGAITLGGRSARSSPGPRPLPAFAVDDLVERLAAAGAGRPGEILRIGRVPEAQDELAAQVLRVAQDLPSDRGLVDGCGDRADTLRPGGEDHVLGCTADVPHHAEAPRLRAGVGRDEGNRGGSARQGAGERSRRGELLEPPTLGHQDEVPALAILRRAGMPPRIEDPIEDRGGQRVGTKGAHDAKRADCLPRVHPADYTPGDRGATASAVWCRGWSRTASGRGTHAGAGWQGLR